MKRKMTVKEAQEVLENVKEWWVALSEEMAKLKKLLDKLPADRPLDDESAKEIDRLLKEIKPGRPCPPHPFNT